MEPVDWLVLLALAAMLCLPSVAAMVIVRRHGLSWGGLVLVAVALLAVSGL
jgi:hypothetical protein